MIRKPIIIPIVFSVITFGIIICLYAAEEKYTEEFLQGNGAGHNGEAVSGQLKNVKPPAEAVKVPILVYHSVLPYNSAASNARKLFYVEPQIFEQQLLYLKENGYNVISFDDLINHLLQNMPLPDKPVVITFDDGYINQYRYAFPLLKKYNYTATFFIFPNAIGHDRFITWPQLKEIADAGMTIGSHSKTHPFLFKIKDVKELRKEIIGSRNILEKKLGIKVDIFAYPFGRYEEDMLPLLKEGGYRAARTYGYKGIFHTSNDLYTLKSVDAKNSLKRFIEALDTN